MPLHFLLVPRSTLQKSNLLRVKLLLQSDELHEPDLVIPVQLNEGLVPHLYGIFANLIVNVLEDSLLILLLHHNKWIIDEAYHIEVDHGKFKLRALLWAHYFRVH